MKGLGVAAAVAGLWAGLYYLGRTWAPPRKSVAGNLPGDEIVPEASTGGDHAITIDAAAHHVWPWLVQMGWHRGGWYTYRWVDVFNALAPTVSCRSFRTFK